MSLTAANSTFMLGASGLYNVPVKIQGYSADDAFASEEVELMEKYMGVDGNLSVGYIPYIVPLDFTLMPDSVSLPIMLAIMAAEKVKREKIQLSATIAIPALGGIWTWTDGYLDKAPLMPSAGKVLKPMRFSLAFESCVYSPV